MNTFTKRQKKEIAEFVISEFQHKNARNVRFALDVSVWATVDVERGTVEHFMGTVWQLWDDLSLAKALRWEAKQEQMREEFFAALDGSRGTD